MTAAAGLILSRSTSSFASHSSAAAITAATKVVHIITTSKRYYSEGDLGTFRGEQLSDSFTQLAKAKEDYYVRVHERDKLEKLRKSITGNTFGRIKEDADDLESKLRNELRG